MKKLTVKPLSHRAMRFAQIYDGRGVESARAAGYGGGERTLAAASSRLLTDPRVKEIILARNEDKQEILDREDLQKWWSQLFQSEDVPLREALRAAELLAKSQAIFIDRVEVRGAIANLSMTELVTYIRNKANLLGISIDLPVLDDDSHTTSCVPVQNDEDSDNAD